MTILHLRICPERHPDLQSHPGRVNLDEYNFTDEGPEMWQQFLVDVAAQVGGSGLGDPDIHEPGQCGDLPHTRDILRQLKSEYAGADDTEDIYLIHFEHAPQAATSEGNATEGYTETVPGPPAENKSESDSSDIALPPLKKAASKSSRPKRVSRSRIRDEDEDEGKQGEKNDVPPEMEESFEVDEDNGDEEIDDLSANGEKPFNSDEDVVEAEAPRTADQTSLTRSDDGHPLIRIGIWLNHDNAQPTLEGSIPMDIVMVAEIKSKDKINYYGVPSWFMNGISIGHFERGEIVKRIDLPTMAWMYTPNQAFAGRRTEKEISERLLELSNKADTQEISFDDYNNLEDEEKDDSILIQPPRTPELADGNFPPASKVKGKTKRNDKDVAIVVYFANNIPDEDLPLELNRQLDLEPEEDYLNFEEWLLDGQGDFEGIGKGVNNEVDEGGWNLFIEYEVFVLPQRPKKEGKMWNWKKQPDRTVASFLNASMEEQYGRKLYIEVHLNVHPDTDKMNAERDKRFESDPKFRRRVSKFSGQPEGGSASKASSTKKGSKKLGTKKSQEDLPAKKGVARKKTSASAKGISTKARTAGRKAQIDGDKDESEHSDEL